jgi:hypothetical protein
MDEGVKRVPEHILRDRRHFGNLQERLIRIEFQQAEHRLGDIYAVIADAFEIVVDFLRCQDEPQIDRHGLLQRKEIDDRVVDFNLEGDDACIPVDNLLSPSPRRA